MRLNVHDFSGHPFQVQLSRRLADRGHWVLHGFSTQFVTGRGRLTTGLDDLPNLRIEGLTCRRPMVKYSPGGRLRFEISYAEAWRAALERDPVDVVIACNVPLFTLDRMRRYFARKRQPWVLWHQDLYSLGVGAELLRRAPRGVAPLGRGVVERIERAQVVAASAVIPITPPMVTQYRQWGIDRPVTVLPNWAPLDEIRPGSRDNEWTRANGVTSSRLRLLYAGTLGRKHNPMLLVELLDAVHRHGIDAELIVASEGVGADELRSVSSTREDIRVFDYQPSEVFGEFLAGADVLLTLLEPEAARFSVPSKVLSYLSAGRPIIALMPTDNAAAEDVLQSGGFVGAPDHHGAESAAGWLAQAAASQDMLATIGRRARSLAEAKFDIDTICDRFEAVLGAITR